MKTVIQFWGMHLRGGWNKNLVWEGFFLEVGDEHILGWWGDSIPLSHPLSRENPNTGAHINHSQ